MKVQVDESDIIGECLVNMIEQGRLTEAMAIGASFLCTIVEYTELPVHNINTPDEMFDLLIEKTKAVYKEACE